MIRALRRPVVAVASVMVIIAAVVLAICAYCAWQVDPAAGTLLAIAAMWIMQAVFTIARYPGRSR